MRTLLVFIAFCIVSVICACTNNSKHKAANNSDTTTLVNLKHLDRLFTPVVFDDSVQAAGIYIYSEAPGYHLVTDSDEGFTCVDDVSRAALVYLHSKNFDTDTSAQLKTVRLLRFILEMQSDNGYFYNFLFIDTTINKGGTTSANTANWWSWRALQTLTEALPIIKKTDTGLAAEIETSINKLLIKMKSDLVLLPSTTKEVEGFNVPTWLPAGSATDQAAIIILGLINYCTANNDDTLKQFIKKLADGIMIMQQGDERTFPYSCFMSWENIWHAYGCDQAYALMKAGKFLKDSSYINKALAEVDNFYPWLLKNGMLSSFAITKKETGFEILEKKQFEQIAYGIRPMIYATAEAYGLTGKQKYADIAAELSSWFFGKNDAGVMMYDPNSGRCFDGITAKDKVNKNSGAESTIECLLALQKVEAHPEIIKVLNKYRTQHR